jgi:fermentation-respiration switch protein FrsA (DUF1100 family)
MRKDIAFASGGLTLRGWHWAAPTHNAPAIVMSHGFSAVKEQGIAGFAEAFHAAGFAVTLFDYRHLGASDGDERGRIVWQEQHDDIRAALGFTAAQPGVDANRIGLWGTSYSGGHAMFVGAFDPRVKVVVAQAPAIDVARSLIALAGRGGFDQYLALLADDHAARNAGQKSGRIDAVAPPEAPSVLGSPDSYAWFTSFGASAPNWVQTTTLESVARMAEYQPAAFVDLIAPKPFLMLAATQDALIPLAQARAAMARAGEPKRLVEIDCGHYDFYEGRPQFQRACEEATTWFVKHLM